MPKFMINVVTERTKAKGDARLTRIESRTDVAGLVGDARRFIAEQVLVPPATRTALVSAMTARFLNGDPIVGHEFRVGKSMLLITPKPDRWTMTIAQQRAIHPCGILDRYQSPRRKA